jgi:hypothetical protein
MASLPTQSFNQIVINTIAGIQGRAAKFTNFSTGSSLRAIVEGFAGIFLWFQSLVIQLLTSIRLSTSKGIDVDTFTADFMPVVPGTSSPRLGAQLATGLVTYSRFTAGPTTCFIPVGSTLTTADGNNIQFAVIADTAFATFQPGPPAGYLLPSNIASIIVPVQAVSAGAAGNIIAGAISVMTSPITGIDNVNNVSAFFTGADEESDTALKQRFAAYILGLSRGDFFGLNAALLGAAVNIQFKLTEGYNYDGSYHPGFFFVVVDDGSGTPSPDFLATMLAAANSVRPLGVQCAVFPPVVLLANVSMQITSAIGYDHNTVVSQVAATVAFNINSLGLANPLSTNQLAAWAYTVPGVVPGNGVSNVLLNGVAGDTATIMTTRLSQDGTYTIGYATVKSGVLNIS